MSTKGYVRDMISVIIAAYNAEQYIEKCLQSLRSQTYSDFEAIIVVDGATDNTFKLCKGFSDIDKRFVTIRRENGGPAAARNTGLENCKGEYVTCIDADDYVDCDFLATLLGAMDNSNCDISACGYISEDKDGNEICRTPLTDGIKDKTEFINNMLVPINRSYGTFVWNKLYKTEIIKKYNIRFPDERKYLFEDNVFNYEYMKHVRKGAVSSRCPYHYVFRKNIGIIRGITENNQMSDKWFHYSDALDFIIEDTYDGFEEFRSHIEIVKMWITATAMRVLAYYGYQDATEYKNMRKFVRKNLMKYLKTPYISIRKKIGMLLTYYTPKIAYRLWAD